MKKMLEEKICEKIKMTDDLTRREERAKRKNGMRITKDKEKKKQ